LEENPLNVFYYCEPQTFVGTGGVTTVNYFLPKSLAKKVNLTYFPRLTKDLTYVNSLIACYHDCLSKKFKVMHFNLLPTPVNGSLLLFNNAHSLGVKTILNIHGTDQLETNQKVSLSPVLSKFRLNASVLCKNADRIVVNSGYMKKQISANFSLDKEKVVVIPNGVAPEMFSSDNKILLEGKPAILFVGNLSVAKGIDVLLEALVSIRFHFPDVRLHLVGPGKKESYFRNIAQEKGLQSNVIFHGLISHSMVLSYYKASDMVVFPSRHEGFGMVVLEAWASGTPLIASDIPPVKELVTSGTNGILFESGNADSLSNAIMNLCNNPHLSAKLCKGSLESAARYSWDVIAEKYVDLYRSLSE
jgi:glycosyltransferase involved in cell wall biosynthesis